MTNFTGNYGNAGGFRVGEQGFTAQVTFPGTPIGSAPIVFEGGNNNTFIAYNARIAPDGADHGREVRLLRWDAASLSAANSTINNVINLRDTGTVNVAAVHRELEWPD